MARQAKCRLRRCQFSVGRHFSFMHTASYKNHERRNICGRRLREIRKSRELSQENVAAMIQLEGLDLTQKAISRMEAGKRLMTDYELKYLADALGVSIPELFENEPEMNSKK